MPLGEEPGKAEWGEYPRARRPVCTGHPSGVRRARMERLVRSGDWRSQPLRGANAAASEIRECLRPDPESVWRSPFRDLSNTDNRWGRSMSRTTKFTFALLLSLPIPSALAQVQNLPETVISATGLPTDSDQIGSSVTVITEEQIQRDQRRTLPDLLK